MFLKPMILIELVRHISPHKQAKTLHTRMIGGESMDGILFIFDFFIGGYALLPSLPYQSDERSFHEFVLHHTNHLATVHYL